MSWPEVLERQAELFRFFMSDHAATVMDDSLGTTHGPRMRKALADYHARGSTPFWVSGDMTRVVFAASESLPEDALVSQSDPPCPTGFTLLAEPIWFDGLREGEGRVSVRALSWTTGMVQFDDEDLGALKPGLVVCWYASRQDEPELADFGTTLCLNHIWPAKSGESYAKAPALVPAVKFTRALWAMMEQRIAVVTNSRAPRQFRRQFERRLDLPASDIRVVTLRRQKDHGNPDGEGTDVNWTHRWIVDGHWRNQPCGVGHLERRLTWISPHVKGPDDLPLVVKKPVYQLVR